MRIDFAEISNWQAAGLNSHAAVPGSLLDIVDAMTEPNQASHLIGYLLHTAVDHLHALKMMMDNAGAQHTFAPYTLIRGAIENASTALWILQEDEPRSVAVRALKLQYVDLLDQERAATSVDPAAGLNEDLLRHFDGCLARNGLTGEGVKSRPPGQLRIIEETSKHFDIPHSGITWQMCSAAAHGRKWAWKLLTLFETQDDDGVSRVLNGRLTSNEMSIAVALDVACNVVRKAREVRSLHSRKPSHTGDSFLKPEPALQVVRPRLYVPNRMATWPPGEWHHVPDRP
jgi:hypothetical protein